MMTVTLTCEECGSAINVLPNKEVSTALCQVCDTQREVYFNEEHEKGNVYDCPSCQRKDFYKQKDFNRKIGVILFVVAAILAIWTYGISLIVLWLFDLFLFKKLPEIVICYKCQTIFRGVNNLDEIHGFNHEMNDRIVYSDHHFEGKQLEH